MKIRMLTLIAWGCLCVACSPSPSTVPLVYVSSFPKDTTINLEKVPMVPAQINPCCMLFSDGKLLVRTSTPTDAIYSVFSYPEMKHLSYFGERSEYIVPLEESRDEFYLVRSDSLCSYKWVEGDSLKQSSSSYFYNVMGQRILGLAKLESNLYAYSNNYFDPGTDEFFIINLSQKQKKPVGIYPDSPVNYQSVSDFKSAYAHYIHAKPDGSRLLVSYIRTRRNRIYDRKGNMLHDILLNFEPCQTVVDKNMKKRFSHLKDVFVTDNAIYLLCPDAKDDNSFCSLIVADWDGKFKARYHINQKINYFIVDESTNRFCGINSNDPHNFYLFSLKNN